MPGPAFPVLLKLARIGNLMGCRLVKQDPGKSAITRNKPAELDNQNLNADKGEGKTPIKIIEGINGHGRYNILTQWDGDDQT